MVPNRLRRDLDEYRDEYRSETAELRQIVNGLLEVNRELQDQVAHQQDQVAHLVQQQQRQRSRPRPRSRPFNMRLRPRNNRSSNRN